MPYRGAILFIKKELFQLYNISKQQFVNTQFVTQNKYQNKYLNVKH